MKLRLKNIFAHLGLVLHHKWAVFKNCAKCGIIFRGIVHDLSKFTPSEFFESARYYQGNRSPIGVCRRATGVSYAWLHHKGHNKHHIEYWLDPDCKVTPLMPYKYAVECICDKLAATRIYAKGDYATDLPLRHWYRYGNRVDGNPRTMIFIEQAFLDVLDYGERYVLNKKYMKASFEKICLSESEPEPPAKREQIYLEEINRFPKVN